MDFTDLHFIISNECCMLIFNFRMSNVCYEFYGYIILNGFKITKENNFKVK